jgi:hypothetical protein
MNKQHIQMNFEHEIFNTETNIHCMNGASDKDEFQTYTLSQILEKNKH